MRVTLLALWRVIVPASNPSEDTAESLEQETVGKSCHFAEPCELPPRRSVVLERLDRRLTLLLLEDRLHLPDFQQSESNKELQVDIASGVVQKAICESSEVDSAINGSKMADFRKIVLHSFHTSSCSWRVRIALAYKGIPYEYKGWNLTTGEQKSEEYTKICPVQLVPALEMDGTIITDSIAILEFLEERFPDRKPLLPKDLCKRAAIRSFVNDIASGIQPLQNLRVLNTVAERYGEEARNEWAHNWIAKGFDALEKVVEKYGGKYCFGEEFSMADVVLAPQLRNAARFKIDMGKYPTLERLGNNVLECEAVRNSRPEVQPDYPA